MDEMEDNQLNPADFILSLKTVWNQCKKCEPLNIKLQNYFARVSNPYDNAIALARLSPDYSQSRPNSLSSTVIEQFSSWISYRKDVYKHCLTEAVKMEAFQIASRQRNKNLSKLVVEAYELKKDKKLFVKPLNDMLRINMYKEVCDWSLLLQLEDKFDIIDFLIPLIFQDKLTVVEEFIKINPKHNLQLVQYLDNIVIERSIGSYMDKLITDLNIVEVKYCSLNKLNHPKSLGKVIKRFASINHIPAEAIPNTSMRNGISTINFLIRKKYYDGTLNKEAFRELIVDACGSGRQVICHLVDRLDAEEDPKEALYAARLFSVPASDMPPRVRRLYEQNWREDDQTEDGDSNADTPSSDGNHQFYVFPLHVSTIVTIDTEVAFANLIESQIEGATVVGIDLEWKPTMVVSRSDLALLQIATHSRVYLVDVLALSHAVPLWREFASGFLTNHNILKIGFSMGADSTMLSNCLPIDCRSDMTGHGYLDLAILWNKLIREYNFEFPCEAVPSTSSTGLSQLVNLCLGKPLNKNEQFSNWETRPLRRSQKMYAAVDAYCLLAIYNVLVRLCAERNIPLDDLIHDIMVRTERNKTKKHKSSKKPREKKIHRSPIEAGCLKLICEPALSSLGRLLRRCGVDTLVINSITEIPEVAKTEGRQVASLPWAFNVISSKIPKGDCYMVMSLDSKGQLNEVLRYFNVILRKEDIFSRCQECNLMNLSRLTSEQVRQLKKEHNEVVRSAVPAGYSDNEDLDSDDEEDDTFWDGISTVRITESYSTGNHPEPSEQNETTYEKRFRVECVLDEVLEKCDTFWGCNECGCCFWDEGNMAEIVANRAAPFC